MTRRQILIGGGVSSVVVGLVAFAFWWVVLRDDAPPAVSLAGAVSSLADETPAATGDDAEGTRQPEPTAPSDQPDPTEASVSAIELNGSWTVASVGETFVGYRVKEELASVGFKTAVGRTPTVEVSLTIVGRDLTETLIVANLQDLESDDSRRDGQLDRKAIETNSFPTATFELTEPIALPASFAQGGAISILAQGTLTLHGVTRAVEVLIDAEVVDGIMVAVGSIPILFADYDFEAPSSAAVLSVEDNGIMEFQLFLAKAG